MAREELAGVVLTGARATHGARTLRRGLTSVGTTVHVSSPGPRLGRVIDQQQQIQLMAEQI